MEASFQCDVCSVLRIYAPNIHQGGGKTLLCALLESLKTPDAVAYVDERLPYSSAEDKPKLLRVLANPVARITAEFMLARHLRSEDVLLCFGNLPPLLAKHPRTVLFLQNRFLLGGGDLSAFPIRARVRIMIERFWLKHRLPFVSEIFVQTRTMAEDLFRATGRTAHICPFVPAMPAVAVSQTPEYDFLYVASGEPHKNHRNLVAAWQILADDNVRPSLALTLDTSKDQALWNDLNVIIEKGRLNISNHADQSSIRQLYQRSQALIYPATFESLGLPLLEARHFNLPILASELDFVRDSLDPVESFDPNSPLSIARAVRRFLGYTQKRPRIVTPETFLDMACACVAK